MRFKAEQAEEKLQEKEAFEAAERAKARTRPNVPVSIALWISGKLPNFRE